jgi:hypothetical protein
MISNYLEKSEVEIMSTLSKFFEDERVISMPISKKSGKVLNIFKITFDCNTERKTELLNYFNGLHLKASSNPPRGKEETIRYCNALLKYSNSSKKYIDILSDWSYGFNLSRNQDWLKNKSHYLNDLIINREIFNEKINKIKSWDPNMFSFEDRISYLLEFGIILNDEQEKNYKELIEISNDEWFNRLSVNEKPLNNNLYCLFKCVIGNSSRYSKDKLFEVETWLNVESICNSEKIEELTENVSVESEFEPFSCENRTEAFENINYNQDDILDENAICSDLMNEKDGFFDDGPDFESYNPESFNYNNEVAGENLEMICLDLKDGSHNQLTIGDIANTFNDQICNLEPCSLKNSEELEQVKVEFSNNDNSFLIEKFEDVKSLDKSLDIVDVFSVDLNLKECVLAESIALLNSDNEIRFEKWLRDSKTIQLFEKLFLCNQYKIFDPHKFRKLKFCNKKRPDLAIFNNSLTILIDAGVISMLKKKEYKFNILITESKGFLKWEYIASMLKNNFQESIFTANQARRVFAAKARPSVERWNQYIKGLVGNGLIRHVCPEYFSF